jgi:predicted anti-sigma-YlaC factor YlaD
MNCEEYQEALSAFLDGNSSEQEAANAFRHLAECENCRRFLKLAVELQHGLRAMPVPVIPVKLDRRIMRIPSHERSRQRRWSEKFVSLFQQRFNVPVPALAGGVCLLLSVLGFSIWLLTHQGVVPEREIIYVVSTPPVEVYGIRTSSGNSQE